jgi:hypothetical protein
MVLLTVLLNKTLTQGKEENLSELHMRIFCTSYATCVLTVKIFHDETLFFKVYLISVKASKLNQVQNGSGVLSVRHGHSPFSHLNIKGKYGYKKKQRPSETSAIPKAKPR